MTMSNSDNMASNNNEVNTSTVEYNSYNRQKTSDSTMNNDIRVKCNSKIFDIDLSNKNYRHSNIAMIILSKIKCMEELVVDQNNIITTVPMESKLCDNENGNSGENYDNYNNYGQENNSDETGIIYGNNSDDPTNRLFNNNVKKKCCNTCKKIKLITRFYMKRNGDRNKICEECSKKKSRYYEEHRLLKPEFSNGGKRRNRRKAIKYLNEEDRPKYEIYQLNFKNNQKTRNNIDNSSNKIQDNLSNNSNNNNYTSYPRVKEENSKEKKDFYHSFCDNLSKTKFGENEYESRNSPISISMAGNNTMMGSNYLDNPHGYVDKLDLNIRSVKCEDREGNYENINDNYGSYCEGTNYYNGTNMYDHHSASNNNRYDYNEVAHRDNYNEYGRSYNNVNMYNNDSSIYNDQDHNIMMGDNVPNFHNYEETQKDDNECGYDNLIDQASDFNGNFNEYLNDNANSVMINDDNILLDNDDNFRFYGGTTDGIDMDDFFTDPTFPPST